MERVPRAVLDSFPGSIRAAWPASVFEPVKYRPESPEVTVDRVVQFLANELHALGAIGLNGAVIGLSGGLDSVAAVRLCQLAVEEEGRVVAVTVDLGRQGDSERTAACVTCAGRLGVDHLVVSAARLRESLLATCPGGGPWSSINMDTRLIQDVLFSVADSRQAAVIATGDLSEKLLGRQTEAFYGQLEPLGSLYKTEVVAVADELGVLNLLADGRPGCEDYWYDDEVLGVGYDLIDPLLHLLEAEQRSPSWIAEHYSAPDREWLDRLANRVRYQRLRTVSRSAPRVSL